MPRRLSLPLRGSAAAFLAFLATLRPAPAADIRIGMVGLDTPHCVIFTQVLNDPSDPQHLPGARVVAAFKGGSPDIETSASHVDAYAREMKEKYHVAMYDSIEEVARNVDAVMIESIDGRPHLDEVRRVFPFHKPVFIDKPLAGSLRDAIEIVRLGRRLGTPFFSASSLRYRAGMSELTAPGLGELLGAFSYGPGPLEPHHPDLYWYGIHAVEGLYTVMGAGCQSVVRTKTAEVDVVTGTWAGGRVGTVRTTHSGAGSKPYGVIAFGSKAIREDVQPQEYLPLLVQVLKFFQTRISPVPPDDTLEIMAFMEAADESARRGGKPVTLEEVMRANEPPSPDTVTIPAASPAELTPANGWPALESYRQWTRSLGGPTSNRFSILDQVNRTNVAGLRQAWIYHSGIGPGLHWSIECNPIVVDGVMYGPTAGNDIVALDAAGGQPIWRYHPEGVSHPGSFVQNSEVAGLREMPARRGLLYWPGDGPAPARLIFGAGDWIYALDPRTGRPIASFGENGRTPLPTGATVGGAVWRHVLVTTGYQGDAFGYDVISGKMLWRFHTIPEPGEFGAETWEDKGDVGANCWGGMALDESRGIAYISTGSPKPNFIGPTHRGDNLFANCVIALDAATGRRLWHFQEVRHDVWDLDLPASPNLVTVMRDGRAVDAVAQVTKFGNTLLLDRVTGKPLFPFRLRRAPASGIPEETMPPYQPDVVLPEPFARQVFTPADITDRTPAAHAFVARLLKNAAMGWFQPVSLNRPTVFYGPYGGANWPGASFDPRTGRLYVTENEMGVVITLIVDDDPPPLVPMTAGEKLYRQDCAACHRDDRRGGIGEAPNLRGIRHRLTDGQVLALWKTGRGMMPPAPPMSEAERTQLLDFLMARDRPAQPLDPSKPPAYVSSGWGWLYDQDHYPGVKPPWGSLNCLDLNTGKLLWKVTLGEYEALTKAGIPKTGTENFGGATVTAGGLVFCAGTLDNRIRAFDADTGAELWSAKLPWRGSGPPSIYEANGREYVVLAATGGGTLHDPTGDAWVAFALP